MDDGLVGAAVQRSVEAAGGGGDARERVRLGRADCSHGRGGAVLLMIGVQDEQHVERLGEHGIWLETWIGNLPHHAQEVGRVVETVLRVHVWEAHTVLVRERCHRGHLGDEADRLDVTVLLVEDVLGFWVEGGQRANGRHEGPHWVGVVTEALHEVGDVFVDIRVIRDVVNPLFTLVVGGQLTVQEQVTNLEERRVLGQLLDWIAAVTKDACVAIDVGDGRRAIRC